MAKTFYVSPGRSYTVTASEGTTITYPGITKPAATVGSEGSVTFNCTGTEIVVSDDNAKIAQNFNNAGAAVAGAGGGSGSTEGVALLEGGNSFSGDQTITGDVTIDGAVTISGDVTAEGEYNGAEVIETQDTTITPEVGKYYKYTGTGDTITIVAPVWNGYMTISYLETAEPIELQGVTWSPAKPSLTGAGPFVYTLVCAESGSILASVMNYSVATAEAIQKVVPMAWSEYTTAPRIYPENSTGNIVIGDGAVADDGTTKFNNSVTIGANAKGGHLGVSIGANSTGNICSTVVGDDASARKRDATVVGYMSFADQFGVAVGNGAHANGTATTSLGTYARTTGYNTTGAIAVGFSSMAYNANAIVIGSKFDEKVDGATVTHDCKTYGTGSITIGAGANTLNNGDTESSNSVTIGCKASNSGADSVVIGAASSNTGAASVSIGAGAKTRNSVAIGSKSESVDYSVAIGDKAKGTYNRNVSVGFESKATNLGSTAIGAMSSASNILSLAVGYAAQVSGNRAFAVGYNAKCADTGVGVFAVVNLNNETTRLYFAGANTPLANKYYNGESFMGYTVIDASNNVLACGTRRLSELFPDNSLTQPASLDENGEWVQPKVFHPSDLDLPIEKPTEPEEYQPLPVYPIVEPEIEEPLEEL